MSTYGSTKTIALAELAKAEARLRYAEAVSQLRDQHPDSSTAREVLEAERDLVIAQQDVVIARQRVKDAE